MHLFQSIENDPIIVRLVLTLVILVIMLIARRFLSKWIIQLLSRVKFHQVHLEESAFDTLQRPINYLILATGIIAALAASPFVFYSGSQEQILHFGELKITLSIISLVAISKLYFAIVAGITTWVIYELEHLYERFFTELNEKLSLIDNTVIIRYLSRIINFITLAIGIATMITILVPDLTKLMTGVGIGGAVVALVAKDSLAGIISGMFLLLDKPFVIGDWISIDNIEGTVEDISFRSTRIRTFSQGLVIIPNNTISNANIINWSRMEKRRVSFELGVTYDTTPAQINLCTTKIREALASFEEIEKGTPVVHFSNFGDYSLNIQILYYTYNTSYANYLAIQEKVNLKIMELCETEQIDIAFPTQTILLQSETPNK
ncbi:MAG: mechanosensitive ion channel family protein [Cellulosilyticum sp.]|nr:mechanosensitive ion channel family protein [Cellulosilyticum sp.]